MNKLTAELARKEIGSLNKFHKPWMSERENLYLEALEIALPILEQQERGDGWIEWRGIHQPVNDSVVVRVKYRSGRQAEDLAACFNWGNSGSIIAYRIIPEQPTNQNGEQ